MCHLGSRLGLRSLPILGLCHLSLKVRTIHFLYRPILSSLKNLYKNNYPKDADLLPFHSLIFMPSNVNHSA